MKRLLIFIVLTFSAFSIYAQELVTLTVLGMGTSKEEAVNNALRSAIEQTFGVFVSANTDILNDEIIKNDIVTLSSGNIKDYKELSCLQMPDGMYSVTLSATVSIGKLVSYAKSKGSAAEFAGAVFGADMKQMELNEKNEVIAIENLIKQLRFIAKDMYDIRITKVHNPVVRNKEEERQNKSEEYFSVDTVVYRRSAYHDSPLRRVVSKRGAGDYKVCIEYDVLKNAACEQFYTTLCNTILSIRLNGEELGRYQSMRKPHFKFVFDWRQLNWNSSKGLIFDNYNELMRWNKITMENNCPIGNEVYFRNPYTVRLLAEFFRGFDPLRYNWRLEINRTNNEPIFKRIPKRIINKRELHSDAEWQRRTGACYIDDSNDRKLKDILYDTTNSIRYQSVAWLFDNFAFYQPAQKSKNSKKKEHVVVLEKHKSYAVISKNDIVNISGFSIKKQE